MKKQQSRHIILFSILSVAVVIFFLLNISLGTVLIPINQLISIIFKGTSDHAAWIKIIEQIRYPKAMAALFVGAGLAVSGLQMQTLFRNPLAGPYVLGINSGASLGVALLVLSSFATGYVDSSNQWVLIAAASIGSASVLFLVLAVSFKVKDSVTLLIVGLMFGAGTGALVSILQYFSDAEQIQSFMIWTMGSLGKLSPENVPIFGGIVMVGLIISYITSKPMNGLLLGEKYAVSIGLNIQLIRLLVIISTALLAGVITAFSGPIAFIGIAVPHIARGLFNTSDHRILFPATILCGAILMLICDTIAQLPGSHTMLPINAVTSLFGAPVVIWIIIKGRSAGISFG